MTLGIHKVQYKRFIQHKLLESEQKEASSVFWQPLNGQYGTTKLFAYEMNGKTLCPDRLFVWTDSIGFCYCGVERGFRTKLFASRTFLSRPTDLHIVT
jgi:hypothetical protein